MGLDTVELIMAIEEEFAIAIPDDAAAKLGRLGEIRDHVVLSLNERGETPDPAAVWERIKAIMRRDHGVREEDLTPDTHIVHDFGLD